MLLWMLEQKWARIGDMHTHLVCQTSANSFGMKVPPVMVNVFRKIAQEMLSNRTFLCFSAMVIVLYTTRH